MNIRLRHSTVNMLLAEGFIPATEEYAHVLERRIAVNPFTHIAVIHLHPADTGGYIQTSIGAIARPGRTRVRSLDGGIPLVKNGLTITVYPVNDSRHQKLLADAPIYRIKFRANLNPEITIFEHTFTSGMSLSSVRSLLSRYEERRAGSSEVLFSRNNRVFRFNFGDGGTMNYTAIGFIPRTFDGGRSLGDVALLLSVALLFYCAKNWFGVFRGKRNFAG